MKMKMHIHILTITLAVGFNLSSLNSADAQLAKASGLAKDIQTQVDKLLFLDRKDQFALKTLQLDAQALDGRCVWDKGLHGMRITAHKDLQNQVVRELRKIEDDKHLPRVMIIECGAIVAFHRFEKRTEVIIATPHTHTVIWDNKNFDLGKRDERRLQPAGLIDPDKD